MSVINMLRGGLANTAGYTQNMYPRPDMLGREMGTKDGWENREDSIHSVARFDLCECWNCGAVARAKAADSSDACSLEVGDEIPLVWIPNRATVTAFTVDVVGAIAGVTLGLKRYTITADQHISEGTLVDTPFTGLSAAPLPTPTVDQAYLDALKCNERVPMELFCGTCDNIGCLYQSFLPEPDLVGGCEFEGQYLSLVIEALPENFDCSSCCLTIDVGARMLIAREGN